MAKYLKGSYFGEIHIIFLHDGWKEGERSFCFRRWYISLVLGVEFSMNWLNGCAEVEGLEYTR